MINQSLKHFISYDESAEFKLANILIVMDRETFGQRKATSMVGGLGRLLQLIEEGKIRSDKPSNKQNGKWFCNAADVLRYVVVNIENRGKRKSNDPSHTN